MDERFVELEARLAEISDLQAASAVLEWDQVTYMPPGGAESHARMIGTLGLLAHEQFVDPAIGRLLDQLQPYAEGLPPDSDAASLIRVTRQDYEKAIRVPAPFMAEFRRHVAASYLAWTRARPSDDFASMLPYLETMIDLSRRFADFFPGYEQVADPLIDYFAHESLSARKVSGVFAALRERLIPIVQAIAAQPAPDDSFLCRAYPSQDQLAFGLETVERLGYDLERGRQDLTFHPFTTTFSPGDVRITTRVNENDLKAALFSTLHEGGHALYEQGVARQLEATPLARGVSSGFHESQSRLWENLVGRSYSFWTFFYPRLQATFPDQLERVPLEAFYRAINKVQPSLIRVAADEVTYNLHVIMRFDLEQELLEGRLAPAELPDAWRARFQADLGITPASDRDGVLQDVHWFGYFVGAGYLGYTLGNIMSAQIFQKAHQDHPEIEAEMGQGRFSTLLGWLNRNIYRHGRKFSAPDLLFRVTGSSLSAEPFLHYLGIKYSPLYGLQVPEEVP